MDSMTPHVSFPSTKETPSSSSGSFLIRAPLTADSDSDSEYESNGNETASTVGGSSLNSFENNSELESEVEEFLSGDEEFETASEMERPLVGDPNEETLEEENNGINRSYKIYVANKDDDMDGLENSMEDEEESGVAIGLVNGSNSNPVVPIAQLSMDDEEFAEMLTDEEMVTEMEDAGFPGAVESTPRINVALGVEGGEEEEPLKLRSSAFLNQYDSSMLVKEEVENGGLEDFVAKDKGSSLEGSQKDVLMEISKLDEDVKHSDDKTVALENLVDERNETKHGDGHEIEEKSSFAVNDPNLASQPVVEPVDEIVVSNVKELMNDMDSSKFSSPISIPDQNVKPEVEDVDKHVAEKVFLSDEDVVQSPISIPDQNVKPEVEDVDKHVAEKVFLSDEDVVQLIFGSSDTTKQVLNEVEHGLTSTSLLKVSSEDQLETLSQQIAMDSDEEVEAEREDEAKGLFNSAALAALLKAATGAELDGGGLTITSPGGSRVVSLERPAHSSSSFHSSKVAPSNMVEVVSKDNISDEDKKRFEKLQLIRVKFLRLVQRLGYSAADPMVAKVLYRLALASGSFFSQEFTLESAKKAAMQLEAENKDDLDFSLNMVVLGKTGVGKSATINSIFRQQKSRIDAFEPATTAVKEIVGTIDGVKIRIFDTPGLRSPVTEEATNCKLLASIKRFVRKFPPDVVLYVDRLDTHDKDRTDFLLQKSLTDALGSSIWQNAIVALTHAASASPEGPSGEPLSFEVFVAQRSHLVHQTISQALGDLRLMNPSMMHPVALVENHPSCQRDRNGESLLPNGQIWRSQLLLLCYSVKILSEAISLSKPQDPFDHQKLFGFRLRSPPLTYLLSSLLQSRHHPKLPNNQVGEEDVDMDIELGDLFNSDGEDYDEYDQLPPFKPLRRSQVDKLSKEQRTAYYEEYDYRVKLLQKKQWREEVKRLREIKKKVKDGENNYITVGHDVEVEVGDRATVPVPLPDMVLPPSFDGDNPTYRYRFLDSESQLLMRPVLDSQGWDHDIGYDGVSLERSLAIAGYFPGAFAVQITKDKREFNIHLDSSVCAKYGENGSTMVGFDIQNVGKHLSYIFRSEIKFRNFKINQTTAGLSVTFLGENVATGLKIEDQIAVGKRLVFAGSAGAMTSQGDTAYGANIEIRLKDKDFPVEQNQSTFGLSLVKWRRDLGLMANLQSQFSIGRSSSMAVRVGLNNKRSGQITLKVSSSQQLHIALASLLPIAASILRMIYPGSDLKSSAC
ncbi:translocase of chloroplast 159, chloroplastic-like [Durio zibethinus]|uniref:Translocase of chloroplast 159, chloroplastic-like n=1 Tax=Durio zibethinus TaxID=66656 RepID=A0A6P6A6J7_DURZI|nr:translocase of chloroplast 159, chloroplastic-like [Durio zibethinus]